MARVPTIDPGDGSAATLFGALAHTPEALRRFQQLGKSLVFSPAGGPDRLKEVAILAVARRQRCDYLSLHHAEIGRAAGLTDDELAALSAGGDGLGPLDALVARFAVAVEAGSVTDADITALSAAGLSDAAIVELTMVSAFYGMTARIIAALDIT